jgi:2-aminoadipate transaminase
MGRSKGVAFVPGRSAYMDVDGRSGANSMRLNFAGVPEEDIREGIRRIAAIAGPDTGLMGALTGSSQEPRPPAPEPEIEKDPGLAEVLELPRRPERDSAHSQDR